MMQSLKRMAGMAGKSQTPGGESSTAEADSAAGAVRQSWNRMGAWGFGGRGTETATEIAAEEDDDRRIRFTIGGAAGRRLTKEDFLKEIQSLDPKARSDVIAESDAPQEMKTMARKDASPDIPGSNRLFSAMNAHIVPGRDTAVKVGAQMARQRGATVDQSDEDYDEGGSQRMSGGAHDDTATGESAVERRRREQALRGTDTEDSQRGRQIIRDDDQGSSVSGSGSKGDGADDVETAAEKRRREAALGFGDADDSDDDDTPRVPPPVARSRGIRFAQSPVRANK